MLSVNISNIAIITIENVDYHCIIHNISKSAATNLLKTFVLENCGYIKDYCLKFQSTQESFFYFVCFGIYKMVDSVDIYNSLDINIGTAMKNTEMLKFVTDHIKNKKFVSMQLRNYLIY